MRILNYSVFQLLLAVLTTGRELSSSLHCPDPQWSPCALQWQTIHFEFPICRETIRGVGGLWSILIQNSTGCNSFLWVWTNGPAVGTNRGDEAERQTQLRPAKRPQTSSRAKEEGSALRRLTAVIARVMIPEYCFLKKWLPCDNHK